jgi:hypothetical protein
MHTRYWLENLKGRDHLEGPVVGGRIILEWILGKQGRKVWRRCTWLRIGTSGSSCEYGNEPLGFKEGREFLD